MLTARGMHRLLAQKFPALGKLPIELIVKVVPVRQYNNRGTVHGRLKQMGIEHHRKGFSATLRMPKHPAFAVGIRSMRRRCHRLADREILMVSGENLVLHQTFVGKADKVYEALKHEYFAPVSYTARINLIFPIFNILHCTVMRLFFNFTLYT